MDPEGPSPSVGSGLAPPPPSLSMPSSPPPPPSGNIGMPFPPPPPPISPAVRTTSWTNESVSCQPMRLTASVDVTCLRQSSTSSRAESLFSSRPPPPPDLFPATGAPPLPPMPPTPDDETSSDDDDDGIEADAPPPQASFLKLKDDPAFEKYARVSWRLHAQCDRTHRLTLLLLLLRHMRRYFKMRKLGMPDGVIQHKLMMDGVTLDILRCVSPRHVLASRAFKGLTRVASALAPVVWIRKVRLPMQESLQHHQGHHRRRRLVRVVCHRCRQWVDQVSHRRRLQGSTAPTKTTTLTRTQTSSSASHSLLSMPRPRRCVRSSVMVSVSCLAIYNTALMTLTIVGRLLSTPVDPKRRRSRHF